MTVSSNPYQADRRRAKAARMEAVIGAAHRAQPSRFASAADAARDDTICGTPRPRWRSTGPATRRARS
jgi:hypothetical protein